MHMPLCTSKWMKEGCTVRVSQKRRERHRETLCGGVGNGWLSVRQWSLGSSDLLKTSSLWSWKRVRKNIIHTIESENRREKKLYCSDLDLRSSSQFDKAPVLAPTYVLTISFPICPQGGTVAQILAWC